MQKESYVNSFEPTTAAMKFNHASTSVSDGSRFFTEVAATEFAVAAGGTRLNLVNENVSNSEHSGVHILR